MLSAWLAIALAGPALAWGPAAHQAVAERAESRLGDDARRALAGITDRPLSELATEPDDLRRRPGMGWTANLHFLNPDPMAAGILMGRDCPDGRCAPAALAHYATRLSPAHPPEVRREALAWVVHLTADVHQPLHVGYAADRGGNDHAVWLGGRETDLHDLWDDDLPPRAIAAGLPATTAAGGAPLDWAEESFQLTRIAVYATPPGAAVSDAYLAEATELVGLRLALAGDRLAALLEVALVGDLGVVDPLDGASYSAPTWRPSAAAIRGAATGIALIALVAGALWRRRRDPSLQTAHQALALLARRPRTLAIAAAGVMASVGLELCLPLFYKYTIDDVLSQPTDAAIASVVAAALGVVAGSAIAWRVVARALSQLTARTQHDLRMRMLDRLQRASLADLRATPAHDVLARFQADLPALEGLFLRELPKLIRSAVHAVGLIAVMVALEWRLTLLALALMPLAARIPRRLHRESAQLVAEQDRRSSAVSARIHEQLDAAPTLRAFGLEPLWRERVDTLSRALAAPTRRLGLLTVMTPGASYVSMLALTLIVLSVGVFGVAAGLFTLGAIAALFSALSQFAGAINRANAAAPACVHALEGLRRISQILDLPATVEPAGDAQPAPLRDRLALRDVSFGYGGGALALDGVSAEILAGRSTAIVGPSGSGKSTLLQLLLRSLDPSGGRIEWDGRDIAAVGDAQIRAAIGYVPQRAPLFAGTLLENIRLGRLDASDEEIEAAAHQAALHRDVMAMPQGYATRLGSGGGLSGGQAQRVAVARALLRRPSVLALDEPTSALDPGAASALWRTLEGLRDGTTTIAVTHDLAAIRGYDTILVLERGRLVGQGGHAALMAGCPTYRRLVEQQSGFSVPGGGRRATITPDRLGAVLPFDGLPAAALEQLAERASPEVYRHGEQVVRQGEPGDRAFVIARGRIEVLVDGARKRICDPGDFVGEIALLRAGQRTADLVALGHCALLSVSRADFFEVLDANPGARRRFEARAARWLESDPRGPSASRMG